MGCVYHQQKSDEQYICVYQVQVYLFLFLCSVMVKRIYLLSKLCKMSTSQSQWLIWHVLMDIGIKCLRLLLERAAMWEWLRCQGAQLTADLLDSCDFPKSWRGAFRMLWSLVVFPCKLWHKNHSVSKSYLRLSDRSIPDPLQLAVLPYSHTPSTPHTRSPGF